MDRQKAGKRHPRAPLDPADHAGGSGGGRRRLGDGKIFGHLVNRSSDLPL
jgi:hypothetical protein